MKTEADDDDGSVLLSYTAELSLQVSFSEKGTKIPPQTHIQKFEILHFTDNISKITLIYNFFRSENFTTSI